MKRLKDKEYEEFQQYLYNKAHGYIWTPDTLELICNGNNGDPEQIGKQILGMAVKLRNEQVSHRLSDKHRSYVIRELRKGETDLLKDFLYEAIFIPEGIEPPARDIIEKPELRVYTDDFGTKKGDNCLVADFGGKVVGAVWTQIMDDYGHVDDETTSFAISLYKEYRGQGIGLQLMVRMLELLKWQGYEKASPINDLITNTIGACLGFCIYKALHKIIPESWYEKIQVEGSQCVFELVIFWICALLIMITIQPLIYHALFTAGGAGGEIQTWN